MSRKGTLKIRFCVFYVKHFVRSICPGIDGIEKRSAL